MLEDKIDLYVEKSEEKLKLLYEQQKNYTKLDDYKNILELTSINANIFIQEYSYNYDINYDEYFQLKDMDISCIKITSDWYSDSECLRTIKLFDKTSNKEIGYCIRWHYEDDCTDSDAYSEIDFFKFPRYLAVDFYDKLYFDIKWINISSK